jgi:hypothetical protein
MLIRVAMRLINASFAGESKQPAVSFRDRGRTFRSQNEGKYHCHACIFTNKAHQWIFPKINAAIIQLSQDRRKGMGEHTEI